MERPRSNLPLSEITVLAVDCQATAAAPRGHLLEIGWAPVGPCGATPTARLIALPEGQRVPPAVTRVTGITDSMARGGLSAHAAWRELASAAATLALQPAPTIIHFARFEQPFLGQLAAGPIPLDVVCTHAIAERVLPDLPRRSLRALAGYFGRSVGTLRRSADHVEATAFVWCELLRLLGAEGVSTWSELKQWLAVRVRPAARRRKVWPMPRDARLALPDAPGIYRLLRGNGDVLYVGKAASLHHRVNSYFRHQHGIAERMLEMLSQARAISFQPTPTALEAALLEPDEIKRYRPPYNIALTELGRCVWFASPDLVAHAARRSARCSVGPFPSADTLEQFEALTSASPGALGRGRWGPDATTFEEGYARFCSAHPELSSGGRGASALMRLGIRLWSEGRRDRDAEADGAATNERRVVAWTPEFVQVSLEWLVIRAALARRRAGWLTKLSQATVAWREPGTAESRVMVIEDGDIVSRDNADPARLPPVPPGHRRPIAARHDAFTIARFDRLRVLTTELKRLVSVGAPVAVRFGEAAPIADAGLAAVLGWL